MIDKAKIEEKNLECYIKNEINILKKLNNNPNIIKLYENFETN